MESCANCGLRYAAPDLTFVDKYRCMRSVRPAISDVFILGRTVCDGYVKVDAMILKSSK